MKRANTTIIGAFVLGALVLGVMGIIVFGGGIFKEKYRFVLFFENSLKGLGPGSQVTFKGVPIGEVKEIRVIIDTKTGKSLLPVYIEVDPSKLYTIEGKACCIGISKDQVLGELINRGLRAQLQFQSLVTGRLNVDLGFYPDTPQRYVGLDKEIKEIPTIPSTVESIARRLEDIPFDRLVKSLINTVDNVDRLLSSGQIEDTLSELKATLSETRRAIAETVPILKRAIASIEQAGNSTTVLIRDTDTRIDGLSDRALELMAGIDKLIKRTDSLLATLEMATSPAGPERYMLRRAIQDLSDMARALKALAESLDERPDMLIKGRGMEEDE